MKKLVIGIIILILLLGVAVIITINKKQIVCPEFEQKKCTRGMTSIQNSDGCQISICLENYIQLCNSANGTWKEFSNTCVDNCGEEVCGMMFTGGCDCGLDKCWDKKSLSCK